MLSTDNIQTAQFTPVNRWEGAPADPAILADGFRFPYACNIVAQNRFMKSAMSEQLATFDPHDMSKSGVPTEELINLYRKFGEGGFGIIVTGCIMVNGRDLEAPGNVIIDKNFDSLERRDLFKRWTAAGKANGSLMIAQLLHPGKYAADLPKKSNFDINTLSHLDIDNLINEYAYAAKFAQECGFDGAEISSAYFYTLGQFLTDDTNSRTDEYGGPLENRSRLLFSIMQRLRMKLPRQNNFVFGVKLYSGNFEPGYVEEDFCDFIHNVEKTGFDYVTITGGHFNLLRELSKDGSVKGEHFYQKVIPAMKKNLTRTKLFMNGNFLTLSDMCEAVQKRWAAGIALAKPVAAEPDLPKKMMNHEVRGAVKSLIDPTNFLEEQQVAGTEMWQHANNLEVMDPSNPAHVEAFYKCLSEYNEAQLKADEAGVGRSPGYPKLVLKAGDQSAVPGAVVGQEPEKFEEEIHKVSEKDLNAVSPIGMHTQTIEDSFKSFERRFEDDGNTEITEESFEKVTTSNTDFVEPTDKKLEKPLEELSEKHDNLLTQAVKEAEGLAASLQAGLEGLTDKITGKGEEVKEPGENAIESATAPPEPAEPETTGVVPKVQQAAENLYNDFKDAVDGAKEAGKDYIDGVKKAYDEMMGNLDKPSESPASQEIISGLTEDNKEIIAGLKEKKDEFDVTAEINLPEHIQKDHVAPLGSENDAQFSETVNFEAKLPEDIIQEAEAAKEKPNKEEKDASTVAADNAQDIEGSIQKVMLNDISLAGLISDQRKKPGEHNDEQEIVAGITADNQKIISGLAEEEEKEPFVISTKVGLLEGAADTSEPSTVPADIAQDIEGSIQKVMLNDISLAGLISDQRKKPGEHNDEQEIVAGITADNQKIISGLTEEEEKEPFVISTKVESSADTSEPLKQPEHTTDDEFKDVKQWLVFNKEPSPPTSTADEPVVEKVTTTSLGTHDSDEFRNVKQWLVFTKETSAPSSELETSDQQQQHDEATIEDQFKHVKQWLVFNRDEAPSATSAAPESDETSGALNTESLPPLESHSISQSLVTEGEPLQQDAFDASKGSPTTHKQMFGSSLQEEKDGKGSSEGTVETVVSHEVFEDVADSPKKGEEKKSGGLTGFFKSAFTNPVQKLFNDTKDKVDKVEEQITTAADEFFDTAEPVQSDHNGTHTLAGDESSLQEVISEKMITTEPEGTVIEEVKQTVKTSGQPGNGHESTTTVTTTTKRTQKKRSTKSSRKDKKGSFEDHGFDFI